MSKFSIGEKVFVARERMGLSSNAPAALRETTIQRVKGRSVVVDLPGGSTKRVATSVVHKTVGVLVLRIGDFNTETSLLNPLSKSILQYTRMLLPDDMVKLHEIRTTSELEVIWQKEHAAITHLVLIAHGRKDAVCFGSGTWVSGEKLGEIMSAPKPSPQNVLSLSCRTGCSAFAKSFSESTACGVLSAPFQPIHGSVASLFCQSMFAKQLLEGRTPRVAFKHARSSIPYGVHFRLWRNGKLIEGKV